MLAWKWFWLAGWDQDVSDLPGRTIVMVRVALAWEAEVTSATHAMSMGDQRWDAAHRADAWGARTVAGLEAAGAGARWALSADPAGSARAVGGRWVMEDRGGEPRVVASPWDMAVVAGRVPSGA